MTNPSIGIFCSTIIPTINRSTLSRAVNSVLDQKLSFADFEVIVVNDSGQPLPDMDWQHDERVKIVNTNQRERSVARNTGAAIAHGKYLHFLDDDDYLLPGAIETFWALDQEGEAVWLYGSYQTVDNKGNLVDEFHPNIEGNIFALLVSGESIPFQVSLLRGDQLFPAGGFDSNPVLTGVEDRDLGRRIALRGSVAYSPSIVAKIRIGEESSSTDWNVIIEGDRWGREKVLNEQNAIPRLRESATSSYLYGRVCRAYLASMVWNIKKNNLFTAISRAFAGLTFSGWYVGSKNFWHGLRTKIK